jgi:altronate hydrolase
MSGSVVVRLTSAPPRPARRIFGKPVRTIGIQEVGGTEATIRRGLELLPELLAEANKCRREAVPVSELSLGLKCGGSDAFSGLSSNPALGHASDILIANGGTSIITETPEFTGAEHLYARRCRTRDGARQVFAAMKRFRDYLRRAGHEMVENPSPGNKEGGLLNITIKSLGSLAKSGTGPVEGVIEYGQLPPHRGHWMLYCPSYDQISTAALVASGCQVIAFTTGRGTGIGNAIAPVLKIASNSDLAARLKGDVDLNAGAITEGAADIEGVGRQLFDLTLATASGQWCRAEHNKHREFLIWDEEGVSL